jgi:hypothetical protein
MRPPAPGDLRSLLDYCLPPIVEIGNGVMLTDGGARFWSDRYGHGLQNVVKRVEGRRLILSLEHPNVLQVRKVNGRLIVYNGNHRAYELMLAGHKTAPALVIEHTNPGEVQWLQGPMFWNQQFLMGERPALISDFNTALAVECRAMLMPSVVDVYIGSAPPKPAGPQPFAIQIAGPMQQ